MCVCVRDRERERENRQKELKSDKKEWSEFEVCKINEAEIVGLVWKLDSWYHSLLSTLSFIMRTDLGKVMCWFEREREREREREIEY